MRIPRHGTRITVVTEDKILSPVPAHFHSFHDSSRRSDTFEDDICSVAVGRIAHGSDAIGWRPQIFQINHLVGTKAHRHFQSRFGSTNDNHAPSARAPGHGKRGDPNRPGPLDNYSVPPFDACALDAVDGRDEGASSANHGLGQKIVRQFEDIRPRAQIVVIGIPSEEVRFLIATMADAVGATVRTASGLPFFGAVIARAAGRGRSPCDAISDTQRLAGPVAFQSFTQRDDATNRLVPEDDGQLNRQFTFPKMNIGPADPGHFRSNQGRARFEDGGDGIFAKLQGLFELFEDGGAGVRHAGA